MVSTGTVSSDANSIVKNINNYSSEIEALASSWSGDSFDKLKSLANEFTNEYKNTINSSMLNFSGAISFYNQYLEEKRNYHILQKEARSILDEIYLEKILREADRCKQRMENYKNQANRLLKVVSSTKLEATDAVTILPGIIDVEGTNYQFPEGPLTDEDIKKLLEIASERIDKTKYHSVTKQWDFLADSRLDEDGLPTEFGCAMFVAYCYNSLFFGEVLDVKDKNTEGFYGGCKDFFGNVTHDTEDGLFDPHNKGFIEVPESSRQDGDVVCFVAPIKDENGDPYSKEEIKNGTADIYANARNCYHVGIYTGDDNIIHSCARNPKGGVHETTIDEYKEGKNRTVSGDDAYAIKHGTKEVYLRYVGEETANEYNRILQTQGQDAALAYLNGGA